MLLCPKCARKELLSLICPPVCGLCLSDAPLHLYATQGPVHVEGTLPYAAPEYVELWNGGSERAIAAATTPQVCPRVPPALQSLLWVVCSSCCTFCVLPIVCTGRQTFRSTCAGPRQSWCVKALAKAYVQTPDLSKSLPVHVHQLD